MRVRTDKDGNMLLPTLLIWVSTARWVQSFCERYDIVSRKQTGKLDCCEEKQDSIERAVGYHLGELMRQFDSGDLDEDFVFNVDKTHFLVKMDNGKTLGLLGDKTVKYADVVSGGEGMTMVVKIAGGVNAQLELPMMIFQNAQDNYLIRGVPDDITGVCYLTGKKGWTRVSLTP